MLHDVMILLLIPILTLASLHDGERQPPSCMMVDGEVVKQISLIRWYRSLYDGNGTASSGVSCFGLCLFTPFSILGLCVLNLAIYPTESKACRVGRRGFAFSA
jgi:hypothetical protein